MNRAQRVGLAVWIAACLGCAQSGVRVDAASDLSGYRTWDWRPTDAQRVDAAHRDESAIRSVVMRVVEGGLARHGFVRVEHRPDFLVQYDLTLERRVLLVDRPRAAYQLSSLSSTPSYVIESSVSERVAVERLRLGITATKPDGSALWRADLDWDLGDARAVPIVAAVDAMFADVGHAGGGLDRPGPTRFAVPEAASVEVAEVPGPDR